MIPTANVIVTTAACDYVRNSWPLERRWLVKQT